MGKSASPWSTEEAVFGEVVVVLVMFSLVVGDVVCDLVGNGLLSLDTIFDFKIRAV